MQTGGSICIEVFQPCCRLTGRIACVKKRFADGGRTAKQVQDQPREPPEVAHQRGDDLTIGGGLTLIWEGNLPIEDSGGVWGKYTDVSIIVASLYARW